jgi:F0F1-type ATP synthase beta subunit
MLRADTSTELIAHLLSKQAPGSKESNVIEIRNYLGEKVVRRIVMQVSTHLHAADLPEIANNCGALPCMQHTCF